MFRPAMAPPPLPHIIIGQVIYLSPTPSSPLSPSLSPSPSQTKMTSNGSSPPATHIGLYQFDKVIGKGNFAVVKLATHSITETKVSGHACDLLGGAMWDPRPGSCDPLGSCDLVLGIYRCFVL